MGTATVQLGEVEAGDNGKRMWTGGKGGTVCRHDGMGKEIMQKNNVTTNESLL